MTNHHVGADTLAKLGTKEKDYYRDGFFAKTHEEEAKAPDLELNVLVGIEDVTGPGQREGHAGAGRRLGREGPAAGDGRDREGSDRQERAAQATSSRSIRADSITSTRTRNTLTSGSCSRPSSTSRSSAATRTTSSIPATTSTSASSGPTRTASRRRSQHYLKWSKDGSKEGDLVFVAGHPGRTDRLNTVASLEYLRDVDFPFLLDYLNTKEAFLLDYGQRGPEAFRQAKEELFSIQNSRKARIGGLDGLRDADFMARKAQAETELPARESQADPKKQAADGAAWDRIAQAQKVAAQIVKPYYLLESRAAARDGLRLRALQDRPPPRAAGRGEAPSRIPSGSRNTATRRSSRSS